MRYVWGMVFLCWGQEPLSLTDTFTIDPRKRLRSYELARKKEGWVFVGYPAVGYDPLRSIGAAAAVALAYNGPKTDPLFAFQPYRYYFFTQLGFYLRESRYARAFIDMPWLRNRPYRATFRLSWRDETQGQFWGIGEHFLGRYLAMPLKAYEKTLLTPFLEPSGEWGTRVAHHYFHTTQFQGWLVGERIARAGLLRLLGGARWTTERATSLQGKNYTLPTPAGPKVSATQGPTLLDSAAQAYIPSPRGVAYALGRWQHRFFVGGALVWDSRDFELNPNAGFLLEAGHESQLPTFSAHKSYVAFRQYRTLYRSPSEKIQLTGAAHVLFSAVYGRSVFFTEFYTYSRWSEGRTINLLSGPSTVRAFRENRFVVPFTALVQYELRSRVAEVRILRQHLMGGPVVFVDWASGRDKLALPSLRRSIVGVGLGARVLWNMATVLRADIAYGREGWQMHFTTGHAF